MAADQWDPSRGPKMSNATGRVIFKYPIPILEDFKISLPQGAEIIRVDHIDGYSWLWAVVNTEGPEEERHFMAFKTGAKIPDGVNLRYLGFHAVFVQMELGLYLMEVLP